MADRSQALPGSMGGSGRLSRGDRAERAAWLVTSLRRIAAADADINRLWASLIIGLTGIMLVAGSAFADRHFHRGMMTGAELPYVFHPTGQGLATNVDDSILDARSAEPIATALQTYGFRFARIPFLWSSIEPEPEQFTWERADAIFEEFTTRDIEIIAVLEGTPTWARADGAMSTLDAPPADPAAYGTFVNQFVRHYADQVRFIQIWDLPNTPERWGGEGATAAAYLELLAAGHTAIQAVKPEIVTVLAEFAPRPADGSLDDIAFLEALYVSGAAPFFEVAAATADGGGRSPLDRGIDRDRANLSRVILLREVMEEAGDGETPLWGTRYGWATSGAMRTVSPDLQAEFAIKGIERSREEWPWLGLLIFWQLVPLPNDASAGYALLTPDRLATPLFTALAEYASSARSSMAGIGYTPTGAQSVSLSGRWIEQVLPLRTFETTNEVGAKITIRFRGTGLIAFLRESPNAGTIDATIDGTPLTAWSGSSLTAFQAMDIPLLLVDGLPDGSHELDLTLTGAGELTVGGFVVVRKRPFLWPVAMLAAGGGALILFSLWQATRMAARRSGLLRSIRPDDVWVAVPELHHVPSTRRF